jgi:oxygen-dependent protoporphyrinogen oxidase
VGGGIAGLAAAWELSQQHGSHEIEVTVFEPERLGGKIVTAPFEGRNIDAGPDAFITRTAEALDLCAELGGLDLVAPRAGRTMIWWRGRLRELPDGLVLGVPKRLAPLATSGLLSPLGVLRAGGDLVIPRMDLSGDVTVRTLVASRFGAEVADRLVDPLVGGIHAGTIAELSAATTVPQLLSAARQHRSLLRGLRAPASAPAGPLFMTPRGGLGELVDKLVAGAANSGVTFTGRGVESLARDGSTWRVEPGGESFDAVVIATPTKTAARILGTGAPAGLSEVTWATVVLVTMAYSGLAVPSGVNGVLVPRSIGKLMTACSFASSKWPHWANPGRTLLRVSSGRSGDRRAVAMSDSELVERLAAEVGEALGTRETPDNWRVHRWPESFPQFRVGHRALVERIFDDLRRDYPGVTLCGAGYQGSGIPACIASGRRAARSVMTAAAQAPSP